MRFADELAESVINLREAKKKYEALRLDALERLSENRTLVGEEYLIEKSSYEKQVLDMEKLKSELDNYDEFKKSQTITELEIIDVKTGKEI